MMLKKSTVNKWASRFGVEIHGKGYLQSLAKGEFKNDTFKVQKELIKNEKPVIFDVGANRGNVTAKYLEHFPKATFFAFEPFPGTFQQLKTGFLKIKMFIVTKRRRHLLKASKNFL